MASLLQKLVRKQSSSKTLISNFNKRILASSTHLIDTKPEQPVTAFPFLFDGVRKIVNESNPSHRCQKIYQSFSFEGFLNPISQTVIAQSFPPEEEDIDSTNDERMIWADSVKKKRKKKMNKHKLKKLRKRLRRKT